MAFVQITDFGKILSLIILEDLVFHSSSDNRVIGVLMETDGILNGFPNGIEIVVGGHFVGSDAVGTVEFEAVGGKGGVVFGVVLSVFRIVPETVDRGGVAQQPVFKSGFLAAAFGAVSLFVPALVDVTLAFADLIGIGDGHHHVDGQRVGRVVAYRVPVRFSPVAIPDDKRVVVLVGL